MPKRVLVVPEPACTHPAPDVHPLKVGGRFGARGAGGAGAGGAIHDRGSCSQREGVDSSGAQERGLQVGDPDQGAFGSQRAERVRNGGFSRGTSDGE